MWETVKLRLPEGVCSRRCPEFLGTQTELLQSATCGPRAGAPENLIDECGRPDWQGRRALPVACASRGHRRARLRGWSDQFPGRYTKLIGVSWVFTWNTRRMSKVFPETRWLHLRTGPAHGADRKPNRTSSSLFSGPTTWPFSNKEGTIAGGYLTTRKTRSPTPMEDRLLNPPPAMRMDRSRHDETK